MVKFKQKDFSSSIIDNTIKGAALGASLGAAGGTYLTPKLPNIKFIPKSVKDKYDKAREVIKTKEGKGDNAPVKREERVSNMQKLALLGTTTLLGAALGAIVGVAKKIDEKYNRVVPGNGRLMDSLVKNLKNTSYKEDVDFTRNSKIATALGTKVCIVISRDASEFKLAINLINDPKLKKLSDRMKKNIELDRLSTIRETKSGSDRYNDINISTISNSSTNLKITLDIIKGFIAGGYPVYIVEVG